MKIPYVAIIFLIIQNIFIIYILVHVLRPQIADLNRETVVYWLLPKNSACAVKMMYLRIPSKDGGTELLPQNRMVCHFGNGMAQPIKPVVDDLADSIEQYKKSKEK